MKNLTTHPALVRDYLLALAGLPLTPPAAPVWQMRRRSAPPPGVERRAHAG
ncbi:hypothetical protein [Rugamonas sp.]|uniref:hypothetical protein n=1 Tax=Rugamonas sp. TaxID=1926287 RepID=UPI0025EF5925|nr:hypothetical protein [Rugamonas sp.]